MKITEEGYLLQFIEPLTCTDVLPGGRTRPLAISGINLTTGDNDQYVLKWSNSTHTTPKQCFNELLGCWIAEELEINCLTPYIINLSDHFIKHVMRSHPEYETAKQSTGINFGTTYIEGIEPFYNQFDPKNAAMVDQAIKIFIFDMFVDNADRGQAKPNIFFSNGNLLILDHEIIFSFIDLLFASLNPPYIIADEKRLYEKHPLLPILKGLNIDFKVHIEILTKINTQFWEKVVNLLPNEWKSGDLDKIKSRLSLITENRITFAEELNKITRS